MTVKVLSIGLKGLEGYCVQEVRISTGTESMVVLGLPDASPVGVSNESATVQGDAVPSSDPDRKIIPGIILVTVTPRYLSMYG
ncbi:hypothetical protein [Bacillus sp. MRMR6]|uniref:hypothetical protein n=1 Tax=Bacillus sp. MRMR6 TaxID=1928617 RepID=UPI00095159ED|nr:hypothetical protein [Bacillus sp. MRMR6]OLS35454.1 hypothetical protein BTR25_19875 [Bacillus sp. MRMR6]